MIISRSIFIIVTLISSCKSQYTLILSFIPLKFAINSSFLFGESTRFVPFLKSILILSKEAAGADNMESVFEMEVISSMLYVFLKKSIILTSKVCSFIVYLIPQNATVSTARSNKVIITAAHEHSTRKIGIIDKMETP